MTSGEDENRLSLPFHRLTWPSGRIHLDECTLHSATPRERIFIHHAEASCSLEPSPYYSILNAEGIQCVDTQRFTANSGCRGCGSRCRRGRKKMRESEEKMRIFQLLGLTLHSKCRGQANPHSVAEFSEIRREPNRCGLFSTCSVRIP